MTEDEGSQDTRLKAQNEAATYAAQGTRNTILALQSLSLPLDAILSGTLGEALRIFAQDQGWDEAARLCDELARQARTLAQPGASELAGLQSAGSA